MTSSKRSTTPKPPQTPALLTALATTLRADVEIHAETVETGGGVWAVEVTLPNGHTLVAGADDGVWEVAHVDENGGTYAVHEFSQHGRGRKALWTVVAHICQTLNEFPRCLHCGCLEGHLADCVLAQPSTDDGEDAEERIAHEYACATAGVTSWRALAAHAAGLHDWPRFFTAAAACARVTNARAQLLLEA